MKDEELVVRKMLESVVGVVDEIVIFDTGSTDSTFDVIESFSREHVGLVHLHKGEWTGDFASARNRSIELATGDWILILDADEYLDQHTKWGIRSFLEQTSADGVTVTIRSYLGHGSAALGNISINDACRIFRSHYRFKGIIHEQVAEGIVENGGEIVRGTAFVHHLGYLAEYRMFKQKVQRNTDLLEKEFRSIPRREKHHRWFSGTNLVTEYLTSGKIQQGIDEARLLIEEMKREKKKPDILNRLYRLYIECLFQNNRLQDALRANLEAIRYFPNFTDLYLKKATVETSLELYHSAIGSINECKLRGDVNGGTLDRMEGIGTYRADCQLGYCWFELGDDLSAREAFFNSFALNHSLATVLPMLMLLTDDAETFEAMQQVVDRQPNLQQDFALHYALRGEPAAITLIDSLTHTYGNTITLRQARFAAQIALGQEPSLPDSLIPDDYVRHGLWFFEQGDTGRATSMFKDGGQLGQYFLSGLDDDLNNWDLGPVVWILIMANAKRYLANVLPRASHRPNTMALLTHTRLAEVFTSEEALALSPQHRLDATWKIRQYILQGDFDAAKSMLETAVLPDKRYSVSGYILLAEMDRDNQVTWLQEALKHYPDSKLLKFLRSRILMTGASGVH
ncbi:glycosyltransferase [Alicyclobacillus dauci]|uniref:Glycosyltransferase n=1 Tax=Alicyclobacillus dauci TaxID=1475485 RepID=A0ABY6Z6P1_9BACL|nr:glycosyltransferase [Alicyclobacillus dauci]WAH37700.1 glycosyltransferase [Alicyclobacillus dauci]